MSSLFTTRFTTSTFREIIPWNIVYLSPRPRISLPILHTDGRSLLVDWGSHLDCPEFRVYQLPCLFQSISYHYIYILRRGDDVPAVTFLLSISDRKSLKSIGISLWWLCYVGTELRGGSHTDDVKCDSMFGLWYVFRACVLKRQWATMRIQSSGPVKMTCPDQRFVHL